MLQHLLAVTIAILQYTVLQQSKLERSDLHIDITDSHPNRKKR